MKSTIITFAIFSVTFGAPVRRQAGNIQTFTSALGGIAATPVEDSGNPDRPFQVKGDTFVNVGAALARSCDQQFNACANAANGGDATLSVAQCSTQKGELSIKISMASTDSIADQCSASIQTTTAAAQGNAQAGGASNANNAGNANAGGDNAGNNANNTGNDTNVGAATSCT